MNESIQQAENEVAIVIYDAPLPPRYFRFTKKFIKIIFVVVPITLILFFFLLFFWGLGSRLQEAPAPSFPVMNDQEVKLSALENEIKSLQDSNSKLSDKLSAQPAQANNDELFLMGIKKPYGMQNLLEQRRVSLDQFEFINESSKVTLKFQIISTNPETKVTGHVLVFMVSDVGLMAYPKEANSAFNQGIKFSLGEPFAVSRLRPTAAEFNLLPKGEAVKFSIYIFSREGDLLLIQETDSFKLGNKS